MSYASAQAEIGRIDRQVDGIRKQLVARVGRFNPLSRDEWQAAWAAHPDLRAQETALFRQRGELQVIRDTAAREQAERAARKARPPKRCPACRGSGYAKAA